MTAKGASLLEYKLIPNECHGYVAEYHLATATIQTQITNLAKQGYTWLRIALPYWHGLNDGLTMDSTGGKLPQTCMDNLTSIINFAKSVGFIKFVLVLLPEGPDDAMHNWKTWDEAYYDETWTLTCNLRALMVAAGVDFIIEMNEGVWDPSTGGLWFEFNQRWWIDYTSVFGDHANGNHVKDATISFMPSQAQFIGQTFSGNLPEWLLMHPYHALDLPGTHSVAEVYAKTQAIVPPGPLLAVGETFRDFTTLEELGSFNPPVMIEWPLVPGVDQVQSMVLGE